MPSVAGQGYFPHAERSYSFAEDWTHTFSPNLLFNSVRASYGGDGFAAEQGSWNRANRGGYEVIRIPMKNGKATGEYEDFLAGFVTTDGQVWGRPVGVTVGHDRALYVTDDVSRSIWRVTCTGK